jgi:hypothetical protein
MSQSEKQGVWVARRLVAAVVLLGIGILYVLPVVVPGGVTVVKDASFSEVVGEDVIIDSSISVYLGDSPTVFVTGRRDDGITFLVYNHADEAIVFSDHSFGLRLFRNGGPGQGWQEIEVPLTSRADPITLPSQLTTYDPAVGNLWVLPRDYLPVVPPATVRVYVQGTGTESGLT